MLIPLAIKTTSVVTALMTVKVLGTACYQGHIRFRTGHRPPEDAVLRPGAKRMSTNFGQQSVAEDEAAATKATKHRLLETRWVRLVQNDLENIPLGMIVMWGAALTPASPVVHALSASVFCASRYAHTYAFATAKQPMRGISWLCGIAAVVTMSINGAVGAFLLL